MNDYKILVFSFTNAGFFSEINNFLLTMIYAKQNDFKILIDYSSMDFIDENTLNQIIDLKNFKKLENTIISNINTRSLRTFLFNCPFGLKPFYLLKYYYGYLNYLIFTITNDYKIDLFQTHWGKIKKLKNDLSKEDILMLFNISKSLWIHNTKKYPFDDNNYIGVHIRRGDKIIESEFIPINDYYNEILLQCNNHNTNNILIFTDLEEEGIVIKEKLNSYNVKIDYINKTGYYHKEFLKLPNETKKKNTIHLCNIVNHMVKASHYIGSNDGNLSAFITLLRENKYVTDLRKQNKLLP